MYPTRVYDVIMYGGAVSILLFIVLMIAMVVVLLKANNMINTWKQAIQTVTHSVLVPFVTLASVITPLLRTKTKKTTKQV